MLADKKGLLKNWNQKVCVRKVCGTQARRYNTGEQSSYENEYMKYHIFELRVKDFIHERPSMVFHE